MRPSSSYQLYNKATYHSLPHYLERPLIYAAFSTLQYRSGCVSVGSHVLYILACFTWPSNIVALDDSKGPLNSWLSSIGVRRSLHNRWAGNFRVSTTTTRQRDPRKTHLFLCRTQNKGVIWWPPRLYCGSDSMKWWCDAKHHKASNVCLCCFFSSVGFVSWYGNESICV